MIYGQVDGLQAKISVILHLSSGKSVEVEFVIDTGFEGALTMPPDQIADLGLPFFQEMKANLANDVSVRTDVHIATITWDGRQAEALVLAMGRRPLLGTALLAGKEFMSQFVDNGLVTIDDL